MAAGFFSPYHLDHTLLLKSTEQTFPIPRAESSPLPHIKPTLLFANPLCSLSFLPPLQPSPQGTKNQAAPSHSTGDSNESAEAKSRGVRQILIGNSRSHTQSSNTSVFRMISKFQRTGKVNSCFHEFSQQIPEKKVKGKKMPQRHTSS